MVIHVQTRHVGDQRVRTNVDKSGHPRGMEEKVASEGQEPIACSEVDGHKHQHPMMKDEDTPFDLKLVI